MSAACMCEWRGCSGTGLEHCAGCGGDQCVCQCGGERECPGCDLCDPFDADEPLDLEDRFDDALANPDGGSDGW